MLGCVLWKGKMIFVSKPVNPYPSQKRPLVSGEAVILDKNKINLWCRWGVSFKQFSRLWFCSIYFQNIFFLLYKPITCEGTLPCGVTDSFDRFSIKSLTARFAHFFHIVLPSQSWIPDAVSTSLVPPRPLFPWGRWKQVTPGHPGTDFENICSASWRPFQESSVTEHRKCISIMSLMEIFKRWHKRSSFM